MILEITRVDVVPGLEGEFEHRIAQALPIFQGYRGWRGMELQRSVQRPNRFYLLARWDGADPHTADFACPPAFQEWHQLVGHLFLTSPEVEHFQQSFRGY